MNYGVAESELLTESTVLKIAGRDVFSERVSDAQVAS
jgi:hypothetical protein